MQMFKNKKIDKYFWLGLTILYPLISLWLFQQLHRDMTRGYYTNSLRNGGASFTYEQNPAGYLLTITTLVFGGILCLYFSWCAYKLYRERKREVDAGFE